MSYNRWMPVQCSSELYHHGVKGMKWGKHLFGNGADIQAGAGGGGVGNEEDLKLLEELKKKYGDKALEMFKKIKQQAAGVPKTVGLTDYTEYKKAQKDYEKLLKDYNDKYVDDHPATYLKPSDEKKKAKQKLGSAKFHRDVQKEQYEQTPFGKAVSKVESGKKKVQQMVRDIKGAQVHKNDHDDGRYDIRDKKEHSIAGAVNKGKEKVKSILGKRQREKAEERRQESAHDRETRKRDKRERDKLVEELKEMNHNRPDWNSKGSQNAQKNPHPNLPRSRKRNVTGKGTGVHIGQTVLPPEPKPLMLITDTNRPTSRKRKVTGKGTGVHVHGSGLNGGRKR